MLFPQYPKWLEDNKDNKDVAADMNNYRLQHKLIGDIITEFDAEKEADTDEVKSKRFEKIMDLMQQVCVYSFILLLLFVLDRSARVDSVTRCLKISLKIIIKIILITIMCSDLCTLLLTFAK